MNIPDAMALRMPVTDTGRGATALFITSPSDDEVVHSGAARAPSIAEIPERSRILIAFTRTA